MVCVCMMVPCLCVQCPAALTVGGKTYAVVSGQHRLCAVIMNLVTNQEFYTKFNDKQNMFKDNKDVTVNYYVLMPETPEFVLKFLLLSINSSAKTTSTPNGVWEFISVFKSVSDIVRSGSELKYKYELMLQPTVGRDPPDRVTKQREANAVANALNSLGNENVCPFV